MADSDIETAVARALEESPDRNFTETVDLAINLRDLDLNEPSNRVDESVVLPAGTGQETTIVVFAEGETAVRAEEVADDVVEDLLLVHDSSQGIGSASLSCWSSSSRSSQS